MSARYLIEVTEEQLCGLRHAAARTELEHKHAIPQFEEAVAAFAAREDEHFLAIGRRNLEHARKWLALVRDAAPALYQQKLKSSPSPAFPSHSAEHEAAAAADLPLSGECGMSLPPVCTGGSALEAQVLVSRESH